MNTIKQLNYLLDKKTKLRLIGLFFMILLGSAAELLGITIILPIIDLAMDTGDISQNSYCQLLMEITGAQTKEQVLLWLIVATVAIYILKNVYLCILYKVQYRFSANMRMHLATRLMTVYMKQPYSYFLNVNSSDLMRSVTADVDQLFQLINNIMTVVSNGVTAFVIVIYLAVSNFMMTITVAGILAICLCIIVFGLQKKNRKNGRRNQYLSGQMTKHLRQAFEGIKEIKIMNQEKHFIDAYRNTYQEIADIYVEFSLFSVLPKYLIEVFAIGSILCYLGFHIAYNPDYLSLLPQLAVFCAAAYKLLPSVNALYASFNMIIYYKASIDLVYKDMKEAEALKEDFEKEEQAALPMQFEQVIQMEEVTFRYSRGNRDILKKASLEIPKGKSVAFVGPSGGGKTTTADILLNLLKPSEGTIRVDGVDIQTNPWGWKQKLGYIPQYIYLTDDTIRANVAFGCDPKEIREEQVWKALEDAQLKDYIMSLPKGLDTEVGERGVRLSGGQRQRIGIARALYRNPEILVFDEATSALDTETEKEVMQAINSLQGTKTMIMIAHRLSTIENCDAVYRIENGEVVRER